MHPKLVDSGLGLPGMSISFDEADEGADRSGSLLGSFGVVSTLPLRLGGGTSYWYRCTGPSHSYLAGMSPVSRSYQPFGSASYQTHSHPP